MSKFKQKLRTYTKKFIAFWKTGKLQRSSRVTYDVVWNIILFSIIVCVIGGVFAFGVGAGYFASLVKDEPIRSYSSMETSIYNYEETSKLYFADNKYIGDIRSDLHRDEVDLKNVSDTLINAVIATEDESFRKHNGVVPKAIVRALMQEATNSEVKTGGSTLTQQLIKNQILTNEVSFERKAKEILLSLRLERFFTKDQILEAYLNIIPYGRDASGQTIAGIQTAAQGVFGVDAKDLNLPQSAYLAGLPQSPSYYTPFLNNGNRKKKKDLKPGIKRMKAVLKRMYEEKYISKEEYDKAVAYDITADFTKAKKSSLDKYPYLTVELEERAKKIIAKKLAKKDGYSEKDLQTDDELNEEYMILADRDLRQKGYEVHSTIDKKTYEAFQKIAKEYDAYGPDKPETVTNEKGEQVKVMEPVQVGGVLTENSTGKIISFVGGRDYSKSQVNHIDNSAKRPNGSTMKPLLVYGPAIEKGIIQPATPVLDYEIDEGNYHPHNYAGGYHGIVSAREALAQSYNIPAVRIYKQIIGDDPATEYLEKMGITTLTEGDHFNESLALGQPRHGIGIEENVNAYTTFGNNGKFVDSYMIDSITTQDGDVIYQHKKSKPKKVFSPQTTYLTLDLMRDVISNGTASYLNSQLKYSSVDWAGKTGTSQYIQDTWFVATNPNVTFGTWMGYDTPKTLDSPDYSNRNVRLWAQLINKASEINPDIVAPKESFKRPDGIVSSNYCAPSGKLPSDLCEKAGLVNSDIFNSDDVPTKTDDSLIGSGNLVKVNGKTVAAGSKTPKEFTTGSGLAFNPAFLKENGYDKYSDLSILYPRTNREKWEKISSTGADVSSDSINDDGKDPGAPASVSGSGNKLTWSAPGDNDIVGYRVYQAGKSGDSYSFVGSTTSTSYSVPKEKGAYIVKAVDYFGRESSGSSEVKFGDVSDSKKDKKADHNKKAKHDKKEQKKKKKKHDKD
ncbi:transglycosylase domain-containing protein [Lentibacillus sp. N15]|uniref:transglycosylase domain-containing protein n=1 Tax=Lentibacillus songyuanensis TaxID=3136161 RepID=UPI0031BB579C